MSTDLMARRTARGAMRAEVAESWQRSAAAGVTSDALEAPVTIEESDLRSLREDVAKPEALSVWELPSFTRIMSSAGMSTVEYQLRLHDLWSLPIRLAAMVLIACAFALSMNARAGGTAALMGIGIAAGFALFILSELSTAIARAGIVPIPMAAWTPSALAVVFAVTLLLYREDG